MNAVVRKRVTESFGRQKSHAGLLVATYDRQDSDGTHDNVVKSLQTSTAVSLKQEATQ